MAFTYTLTNSAVTGTDPAGTDLISLGDDNIRAFKSAMIERVNSRFVDVNSDPWIIKLPVGGTGNTQTLVPTSDNLYTLGTVALRFADIRTVTLTVSGAASIGGLTVNVATGTSLQLNTTNNVAGDFNQLLFSRGGTTKWRLGTNITGGNVDSFDIYAEGTGGTLRFLTSGAATFSYGVTIAGGLTVTPTITIDEAAGNAWTVLKHAGTPYGYVGITAASNAIVGAAVNATFVRSEGIEIDFSANSGASVQMRLSSAGALTVSVGGATITAGNLGIGAAQLSYVGAYVSGPTLSGSTTQYGALANPTFSSGATTSVVGYYTQIITAAAAFTVASSYGVFIATPSKGAGSVITTGYGLYIETQNQAGTNYAIYTNTGPISFGDGVTIRTGGLAVTGNSSIIGTLTGITALTATSLILGDGTAISSADIAGANRLTLNSTVSAANATGNYSGGQFSIKQTVATTGTIQALGGFALATHGVSSTITRLIGVAGSIEINSAGTVTWACGLQSGGALTGGFATNFVGLYVAKPTTGAVSPAQVYGVYVEDYPSLPFSGTGYSIFCVGGNVSFRNSALATGATQGHLFIPTSAGAPTGAPASTPTGQAAFQYDSTNNQLYVYNGAWKKTVALT